MKSPLMTQYSDWTNKQYESIHQVNTKQQQVATTTGKHYINSDTVLFALL